MQNIQQLVKRKKIRNILLNLILVCFCIFNIIFNFNNYYSVLFNNYYEVNNIEDLNNALKNNEIFVLVNLKNAKLNAYSLKNSDNSILNSYTLSFNNKNILVLLEPNTIITNKVLLEILTDTDETIEIKNKLDCEYVDNYLSNDDLNFYNDLILVKIYMITLIILLSLISTIVNIKGFFNPTKTFIYKKYNKELYK